MTTEIAVRLGGRSAPRPRLLSRLRPLVLGGLTHDDARRLLGVPDRLHREWLARGERGLGMDPRDADGAEGDPGLEPEAEYAEIRLRCSAEARARILLERFRRALAGGQGSEAAARQHLAYLEEGTPDAPGGAGPGAPALVGGASAAELARLPDWARAALGGVAARARALAAERDAILAAVREGREIERVMTA